MSEFRDTIQTKPFVSKLPALNVKKVVNSYERAKNRLIISDYDGTLTKIQTLPQLAQPANALVEILRTLSSDPHNTVFIMSGRERRFLESWLGALDVGMASENGFYHKMPGESEWESIGEGIELSWKELVEPIMQYFTERTPGTYIESKESSLAWHFKDADPHFGAWQAKDMQISMEDVLSNLPLEIIQGNHTVEVRHRAVSKARVLEKVLAHLSTPESIAQHGGQPIDFIFCVGDDRSDEEMFVFLEKWKKEVASAPPPPPPLPGSSPSTSPRGGAASPAEVVTAAAESPRPHYPPMPPRPPPALFNVHIGNNASQATSFVESTLELRRVLRVFSTVSKKESDLRDLGVERAPGPRVP